MYNKQFKMDGIRKNAMKNFEESYVVVDCIVRDYNDEPYLCLLNGVTGRESIAISQLRKRGFTCGRNWQACYGSKYKWDNLEVLGEDIELFIVDWDTYLIERAEKQKRLAELKELEDEEIEEEIEYD